MEKYIRSLTLLSTVVTRMVIMCYRDILRSLLSLIYITMTCRLYIVMGIFFIKTGVNV